MTPQQHTTNLSQDFEYWMQNTINAASLSAAQKHALFTTRASLRNLAVEFQEGEVDNLQGSLAVNEIDEQNIVINE
jgi:hypothetical protein